ncbi:MAG: hypothetical protein AB1758_08385 [Candidatus Eremiobacterota bacterium]
MDLSDVRTEVEAAHERAREAFGARDVEGTMAGFSRRLRYRQLDGRWTGWVDLRRDVQRQFASLRASGSRYEIEGFTQTGTAEVTETLSQTAWAEVVAFLFLRRRWTIRRRARYVWTLEEDGQWRISEVQILEETVR